MKTVFVIEGGPIEPVQEVEFKLERGRDGAVFVKANGWCLVKFIPGEGMERIGCVLSTDVGMPVEGPFGKVKLVSD